MKALILASMSYSVTHEILHCLKSCCDSLYVIAPSKFKGIALSSYCHGFYEIDYLLFEQANGLIQLIGEIQESLRCDVLLAEGIESGIFLAKHREALKSKIDVPEGSPASLIERLNNKWLFCLLLQEMGLPTPHTVLIENAMSLTLPRIKFPVLSKPLESEGGRGILLHNTWEELIKRRDALSYPFLLQEYIPGQDYCMSCLCENGRVLAWTTREHCLGGLNYAVNNDIRDICSKVIEHTQYSGPAHFDLRVDEKNHSAKLLECNPRFWGGIYGCFMVGVNFPELTLQLVQGLEIKEEEVPFKTDWIPLKKKQLLAHPLYTARRWKQIKPHLKTFSIYLKEDGFYLFYKFINREKDRDFVSESLLNLLLKYFNKKIKFRSISGKRIL